MSANGKVSMAEVQPKHRKFVREVANGRSPEEVIRELYPNDDVAVAMRRVQTPKVLALLESLVSARWEKSVLLARLSHVIEDESTKASERITAMRLGAQVKGYLSNAPTHPPRTLRGNKQPIEDSQLLEKMAELGRKAYKQGDSDKGKDHGHTQKPS